MKYTDWNPRKNDINVTVKKAYEDMQKYVTATNQKEIPLMVQFFENPRFKNYRGNLFKGSTTLKQHDILHILLNKDMSMQGEAYTIGFSMGSTKKNSKIEIWLFLTIIKYFYPKQFRFGKNDVEIFKKGFIDGSQVNIQNIEILNYEKLFFMNLYEAREQLKILK